MSGPATDQVLGHADGDDGRNRRDGSRLANLARQVLRQLAEENGQRDLELLQRLLEERNRGPGVGEKRLALFDVEGADFTGIQLGLADADALLLVGDIPPGHGEALFGGANEQVGLCHLADERHQDSVVAGEGGVVGRRDGLDLAPDSAPDIDFPSDVEVQTVNPRRSAPGSRIHDGGGRTDKLFLRKEISLRDQELLTCLQDAQRGRAESQILGEGLGDKLVEDGILECLLPPERLDRRGCLEARVLEFEPLGGDLGRGRFVVRADHRASGKETTQPRKKTGELERWFHADCLIGFGRHGSLLPASRAALPDEH